VPAQVIRMVTAPSTSTTAPPLARSDGQPVADALADGVGAAVVVGDADDGTTVGCGVAVRCGAAVWCGDAVADGLGERGCGVRRGGVGVGEGLGVGVVLCCAVPELSPAAAFGVGGLTHR
jgi:hypothetical protein